MYCSSARGRERGGHRLFLRFPACAAPPSLFSGDREPSQQPIATTTDLILGMQTDTWGFLQEVVWKDNIGHIYLQKISCLSSFGDFNSNFTSKGSISCYRGLVSSASIDAYGCGLTGDQKVDEFQNVWNSNKRRNFFIFGISLGRFRTWSTVGYPRDAPATVLFGEWFRFGKPSDRYQHNVALTTYFRLMVSSPKTRIRLQDTPPSSCHISAMAVSYDQSSYKAAAE
ncbi:hypothetical protein LXL04_010111 [Taraxacum kok-saghyz]